MVTKKKEAVEPVENVEAPASEQPGKPAGKTVACKHLNLRQKPDYDGLSVAKLPEGTELEVLEEEDGWSKVAFYVRSEFLA